MLHRKGNGFKLLYDLQSVQMKLGTYCKTCAPLGPSTFVSH